MLFPVYVRSDNKDLHRIGPFGNKYEDKANRPFLGKEVLKRCHTKDNPSIHLIADDLISYNIYKTINLFNI